MSDGAAGASATGAAAVELGFPDADRMVVARLYWEAFSGKLGLALGPADRAERYMAAIMDPRFALVARAADGTLLGVAGFKTLEGALIGGRYADLVGHYGPIGALWRGAILSVLERAALADTLQMDGIAVAGTARGQGLGSRLLAGLQHEARARGLSAVQLDVIDSNDRARALYERCGFVAVGEQRAGILAPLLGFRRATTMRCPVT